MEISIKKGIIGGINKGKNKSAYEKWYKKTVSIGDKIVLYISWGKIKTVKGIATIAGKYEFDEKCFLKIPSISKKGGIKQLNVHGFTTHSYF